MVRPVKIVVHGASGRVGQVLVNSLPREPDLKLVGAVDIVVAGDTVKLPDGSTIPFSSNLEQVLSSTRPDVMVDFSLARASMPALRAAAGHGVNLVIGTTGFTPENISEIESFTKENNIGTVLASNFALGAVLMMHFAKLAAKYLDYAEIIELHHNLKADAPSGTALSTAKAMVSARGQPFCHTAEQDKPFDSRGKNLDGINIHSVRLPGLMAHQEVLFGAPGQTLSIRHDTIGRECYVPGVILAVKRVVELKGMVQGLDILLDL